MCLRFAVEHPELVLKSGEHEGHEYIVTTNGAGFRCGYVKVNPGHPWHGKRYVEAQVHGGVNFAEADIDCGKGGADSGWWLGFDCGHAFDAPDPTLPGYAESPAYGFPDPFPRVIRGQDYVERQCKGLCEQAARA